MFHYFKKFWFRNLVYLVIAAVQAGLTIVTALLAAAELNALIKFDFNGFLKWTLLDIGAFALLLGMNYVGGVLQAKTIQKMANALRRDIGTKLSQLPYSAYHAHQASD